MQAKLLVISGPDQGKSFEIVSRVPTVVGRSGGADIKLNDQRVSPLHCKLEVRHQESVRDRSRQPVRHRGQQSNRHGGDSEARRHAHPGRFDPARARPGRSGRCGAATHSRRQTHEGRSAVAENTGNASATAAQCAGCCARSRSNSDAAEIRHSGNGIDQQDGTSRPPGETARSHHLDVQSRVAPAARPHRIRVQGQQHPRPP